MPDPEIVDPAAVPQPAAPPLEQTPTPEVAAAVEAAPVAAEPAPAPERAPTLLDEFDAKQAEKVADPAKEPEAKPEVIAEPDKPTEEAKPPEAVEAKPEAPVYTFELPEILKADEEKMGAFTGVLGEYGVAQDAGQKLLNLHATAMQTYAEHVVAEQWKTWNDTQQDWRTKVLADPVLGGAGHQTAMTQVALGRDMTISDAKPGTPEYAQDRKDYEDFTRITGAGNHPFYLKQLHRFARFATEPALPPANPRPAPGNGQRPVSRFRDVYNPPKSGGSS